MAENTQKVLENGGIETENDAVDLLTSVDKYVTVHVTNKCSYTGFVHAIDPESRSIILSIRTDNNFHTTLIPGHAVKSIITKEPDFSERPAKATPQILTTEDIERRKTQLISWLKKNFLPATENNGVIDVGDVSILPPYTSSDISTENAIVAVQFKKIIDNMPLDYVS